MACYVLLLGNNKTLLEYVFLSTVYNMCEKTLVAKLTLREWCDNVTEADILIYTYITFKI